MELAGKVIAVLEAKGGQSKSTGNPWKSQEYVIETHETYPHRMCFSVFGEDKINQFNIQLGEEINVFFDFQAREYQGRWYNDLRAWRIDRVQPGSVVAGQAQPQSMPADDPFGQPSSNPVPPFVESDSQDDLPF